MIIDEIYNIIIQAPTVPTLTKSSLTRSKFNIVYNTNYTDQFIYEQGELLIFKDCLLQIFNEAYQCHDWKGLLLTTNDNHHVINRLPVPNNDTDTANHFKYISCLLRSNINKINKSSLLWLYYKKLVIVLNPDFNIVIDTVINSSIQHLNNYYCWEFMNFYLNLHYIHHPTTTFNIDKILKYCFQNVNDHSSWQFLNYNLNLSQIDPYYHDSCQRLHLQLQLPFLNHSADSQRIVVNTDIITDVIKFITISNIKSLIPYQFLIRFHQQIPTSFFQSVNEFETLYQGEIELRNGYYEFRSSSANQQASTPDMQDLKFVEGLQINGNKKRLLKWLKLLKL